LNILKVSQRIFFLLSFLIIREYLEGGHKMICPGRSISVTDPENNSAKEKQKKQPLVFGECNEKAQK
jgi:hypothetical protein